MNLGVSRSLVFLCVAVSLATASGASSDASPSGSRADGSSALSAGAFNADYVLQPQDVIKVQVFQEEDINKQADALSISKESTVTLPLIGTINLRGKTVRQAEDVIRRLYDKDFIVNPQVTVTVVKYAERSVNVMGSVTNQGRIQFPQERGLTIVEAIALAGGQTRLADLKRVRLTRVNADGDSVTTTVDVDAMMKAGNKEAVVLQSDDVIFVPERIL